MKLAWELYPPRDMAVWLDPDYGLGFLLWYLKGSGRSFVCSVVVVFLRILSYSLI